MHHYLVVSPEMSEVIPILDFGEGPLEYFACSVFVEAQNQSEAKSLAIKTRELDKWVQQCRSDSVSPFIGLTVEKTICEHGICWCEICADGDGFTKCTPCLRQLFEEEQN